MSALNPGDAFPDLGSLPAINGDVALPEALAGHYGVVLFNRGAWCPYCRAQLSAFHRAHDRLEQVDAKVVSLTVDDEQTTKQLVDELELDFPVAYGVDADAIAAATGAFVNPEPRYLQSTGFVLDPQGKVIVSVYSTGAIGRLVPADVAGLIEYVRSQS